MRGISRRPWSRRGAFDASGMIFDAETTSPTVSIRFASRTGGSAIVEIVAEKSALRIVVGEIGRAARDIMATNEVEICDMKFIVGVKRILKAKISIGAAK